jgi:hypothetical protein
MSCDGPRLIRLAAHSDERGTLIVGESGGILPFVPVRFFLVHSVPADAERGGHAVVNCDELIVPASGSFFVGAVHRQEERIFALDTPEVALFLPRDTYSWQFGFTPGAVMLVLASEPFATTRYVSDKEAYSRGQADDDSDGRHRRGRMRSAQTSAK